MLLTQSTLQYVRHWCPQYINPLYLYRLLQERGHPQPTMPISHPHTVPTIHQDDRREASLPLNSASYLRVATKDSCRLCYL